MLKKLVTPIFVVAAVSSLSSTAFAEEQYYAGGNFGMMKYSVEGADEDASLNSISGRIGMQFNEYMSGELRVGFGIGSDEFGDGGPDLELDYYYGGYMRLGVPVENTFYPYLVAGYTKGEVSVEGASESVSESDFSIGLGTDVTFGEGMKLNVEYMNYIDKDGGQIDGFTIGVATTF